MLFFWNCTLSSRIYSTPHIFCLSSLLYSSKNLSLLILWLFLKRYVDYDLYIVLHSTLRCIPQSTRTMRTVQAVHRQSDTHKFFLKKLCWVWASPSRVQVKSENSLKCSTFLQNPVILLDSAGIKLESTGMRLESAEMRPDFTGIHRNVSIPDTGLPEWIFYAYYHI